MTPYQLRIARLRVEGLSRKEIAARLGVADSTVRRTIERIYSELKIKNVVELVRKLDGLDRTLVTEDVSPIDSTTKPLDIPETK